MNNKNRDTRAEQLYKALLTLNTIDECAALFDDLCTISEINAMSQRFEVAQLLSENMVYSDIMVKTGASSATISRVARCLNYGRGGYAGVLRRLEGDENGE